jgi:hypothetical protein
VASTGVLSSRNLSNLGNRNEMPCIIDHQK